MSQLLKIKCGEKRNDRFGVRVSVIKVAREEQTEGRQLDLGHRDGVIERKKGPVLLKLQKKEK